jgi:hypothetical protein
MKIALCFSGQLRTGVLVSKNILNYIGDIIEISDVFVHTWDSITQTSSDLNIAGVPFKEPNVLFEEFSNIWKPKKILIENYTDWVNMNLQIEPLFYSLMRCNTLRKEFESENNVEYDFVIKIRPDFIYSPLHKLKDELDAILNSENINTIYTLDFTNKLVNNKFEDVFWIATPTVFDTAVNYYFERLQNNELDWQIEMAKFLINNGVSYKRLVYGNVGIPYRWDDLYKQNKTISDFENEFVNWQK